MPKWIVEAITHEDFIDGLGHEIKELVECEKCKKAKYDKMFKHYWCRGILRRADFFCADGERREDGI